MLPKASLLILSIGLIALLSGVSGVPFCLSYHPAIGPGGSCSGGGDCRRGLYCNNQSICVENLRPGTPCIDYQDTCVDFSDCKGRTGFQTCIAKAGAGASCSNDGESSLPYCGNGLSCDGSSGTCMYGAGTNDTCAKNLDCSSRLCVNSKCFGFPRGASCEVTAQCAPGLFCQGVDFPNNGTCVPLLTAGTCNGDFDCAFGYVCAIPKDGDDRQCLKESSRKAGDYCRDSRVCESQRCVNDYCARNPGEFCWSDNDCGINQVCGCSGSGYYDGVASCTDRGCLGIGKDLLKCFQENCNGDLGSMLSYTTSCLHTLCPGQTNGLIACALNSGMTLSISLFFVAFLAFFATSFQF